MYDFFSKINKVRFTTLKKLKKEYYYMPDSAFSHKCTPILNLSKKGVRGEKPYRGKQMAHRTHRVRTVRQKNASTAVFDK